MTPAERSRLRDALADATGQVWFVSDTRPMEAALALDGVSRDFPSQVSILRAGNSYLLVPDPRGWPYCRRIDFGLHVGRGWLPRLVADAVVALREYDAHGPPRVLTARDRRRAEVYRAILRPESGAAPSEREQAERYLRRMG